MLSNNPPVTGITTRSFRLADDFHDLTTAQPKVTGDGVRNLYTGQLGFLQTVASEESLFLLGAEKDMLGNELMAGDVDEQILFLEVLADPTRHTIEHADGGWRDGGLSDKDSGMVVPFVDEVVEGADLLRSHG